MKYNIIYTILMIYDIILRDTKRKIKVYYLIRLSL